MRKKKPSRPTAQPAVLETFGGGYQRFESVFQPRTQGPARSHKKKDAKKNNPHRKKSG